MARFNSVRGPWKRAFLTLLAVAAVTLGAGVVYAQETADAVSPGKDPERSELTDLLELNKGIQAYVEGDGEKAERLFKGILERDPDHLASLYYLSLIYLDRGVRLANQAPEQARELFVQARENLERVAREGNEDIIPVTVALDLGISQLAGQDAEERESQRMARAGAERAAQTLEDYVQTAEGQSDPYGHFFLGVGRFRLAYFARKANRPAGSLIDRAESAFDRAIELSRSAQKQGEMSGEAVERMEIRVAYYEGLLLMLRRQYDDAKTRLGDVAEADPRGQLGVNAAGLVDFIEENQPRGVAPITLPSPIGPLRFEGRVEMGYTYDSNLILLGEDTRLPLGIPHKWDHEGNTFASFDVTRVFTRDEGFGGGESLLIGVGGSTFHTWHPSVREFDINQYAGRAYVNWEPFGPGSIFSDVFLGLEYDYTYTQLGHDPFISSNRITPVITKRWREAGSGGALGDERARTDVYYSFDYRNYLDILNEFRFDRDGKYHMVGVTQSFNLWQADELWPGYYTIGDGGQRRDGEDGDRWMEVWLGYRFRDERTQGTEFDMHSSTLTAGMVVPLPYRLSFDFIGEFSWDDYTEPSLLDYRRNPREDFVQRYSFGLTRTLVGRGENASMPTLDVRLRAEIDLTFQDSNVWDRLSQDVYSYDRAVYGLRLIVRF